MDELRHIGLKPSEIGPVTCVKTGLIASRDICKTISSLFECLKGLVTDTERTSRGFGEEIKHNYGVDQKVYFRLNTQHGLEQIGLED
jgi:hypothetical protein